ncbi:MAG: tail tape measure protein [Pseudomonadota bacterium]
MDDEFDELVIDVRASTEGFAADLESLGGLVGGSLLDSFGQVGATLEKSLLSAIRKGSLGFDDLKNIAMQSLDQIAAHALESGIGDLFGGFFGGSSGGSLGGFEALLGPGLSALLGLPGRATGGPVSPGRGYVVGENGPELFVPTSAGRVERSDAAFTSGRDVRVAINVATPSATAAPIAMRRSSRQIASAVRQAIANG